MRFVLGAVVVTAQFAISAAAAQDTTRTGPVRSIADSAIHRPDCIQAAPARIEGTATDSLCLTRREAITAAIARNPQMVAAKEQVAQARARRVQGVAIPDPSLSFEVDQATGLFSGQAHDKVLNAALTIPFPDKFRLRGRIGRADIQNTEASLLQLQQSIAAQTSQTYDSILAALRHGENLREAKRLADDFLKKTQARFDAGSTPRLDVIKARVDVAQAENDLIVSEHDVANARSALNRLLDRPLGAAITVADSLAVPPDLPPLDRLEAAALAGRPELAGLERQREGARATTALAREYWFPDLTFGLSHNYADPGPGVLFTGISLPLPVFFWQHTKGEIAEARHRELELDAGLKDLRSQVGLDVRTTYATAITSLRQVIFLRDQLVPSAREAYRIASVSYGLGGSSALEVLDARRVLRDAENQFTDALAAANIARADLERAVGRPLDAAATGGTHD
jgi:cobalt-zinc-cadmium efflux system outer membrane protein